MDMTIHRVRQGSEEWKELRKKCFTASEASAMMAGGAARDELLHLKATGSEKEWSDWEQRFLLDKGHELEAATRPLIEKQLGMDLFPAVISRKLQWAHSLRDNMPDLLASFDGLTMDRKVFWECKTYSKTKSEQLLEGEIPVEDVWQLVQQFYVSGAEFCYYTLAGAPGGAHITRMFHRDMMPDNGALFAGWSLFKNDLENGAPAPKEATPRIVAEPVKNLPALTYRLNGLTLTSNIEVFREAAKQLVEESKKPLNTDQEFANREALCKRFQEAEDKLALMREQVIGEVADIDKFQRDLGEIAELIRQARLAGEKQVKARKDEIRREIADKAKDALNAHMEALNARFGGRVKVPTPVANFSEAMKGRRTLATLQSAADSELNTARISAEVIATRMEESLRVLDELSVGHEFLFRDVQQLAEKGEEVIRLLVPARINEYQEIEAQKKQLSPVDADQGGTPGVAYQPQADVTTKQDRRGTPDTVFITDFMALVKAVANGEVPLHALKPDMDKLLELSRAFPVPGVTLGWTKGKAAPVHD